eukprot:2758063-Prymnesium_polylepis.1
MSVEYVRAALVRGSATSLPLFLAHDHMNKTRARAIIAGAQCYRVQSRAPVESRGGAMALVRANHKLEAWLNASEANSIVDTSSRTDYEHRQQHTSKYDAEVDVQLLLRAKYLVAHPISTAFDARSGVKSGTDIAK